MPEISRFYGIIIQMSYSEHGPPHFHAIYGKEKVAVEIDPLRLMRGRLPPREMARVQKWASMHRDELMDNWRRLRSNQVRRAIDPLP